LSKYQIVITNGDSHIKVPVFDTKGVEYSNLAPDDDWTTNVFYADQNELMINWNADYDNAQIDSFRALIDSLPKLVVYMLKVILGVNK
jgi:hypothetical protein